MKTEIMTLAILSHKSPVNEKGVKCLSICLVNWGVKGNFPPWWVVKCMQLHLIEFQQFNRQSKQKKICVQMCDTSMRHLLKTFRPKTYMYAGSCPETD